MNRIDEIVRLLTSIAAQKTDICQVLVVDGGDKAAAAALSRFADTMKIDYIRRIPPSLTAQRNAGIAALNPDATLVAFFDDDIVLDDGSLDEMMRFWERAPVDAGGASFNLVNEIYVKPSRLERLFLVNAVQPNRILRSGFQGKAACVKKTIRAEWLVGCAMVYRRDIFVEYLFDEWFSGYARYEDVDFSYRVGKKYSLYVVAEARARHLTRMEVVASSFALAKMECVNRLYFVRKHRELSVLLCHWALTGILLNNVCKWVRTMNKRYLYRAQGIIAGFAAEVTGR